MSDIEDLRRLSKPELAAAVAQLVRSVICHDGWSLEKGRDCVDVLLIAARTAFPTRADIQTLGRDTTVTSVAVELADSIDVIKEEAKNAPVI